jgi:DNA-binding CsgD family transcriptional regulator
MAPKRIVRRRAEVLALSHFLDGVPREPSAAVIVGEPGIGKTTLWLDTLRRAEDRGFRVLAARAAAAESVLAYTTLGDLLGGVEYAMWADLPAPQQLALDAALLRRREDVNTDVRAVSAAFVAVINGLAAQGPTVLAIDDLQWLDASSASVLSFAARRLPDQAALLCTTRTEQAPAWLQLRNPDAVRQINVAPLTVGELHQVLMTRLDQPVARPILLRIHEIAGGNPFYALELAREINARTWRTQVGMPDSLAELVRTRIGRVSAGAEDALLAIASLAEPTVELVARVTGKEADHLLALLEQAESQSVVSVEGTGLRFTHPVLAHGVYSRATAGQRRAMHRRLAELVTEPELRARHLALSDTTGGPQTLEALDTAAEMARRRGAPGAAAELLELAMGLGGHTAERRIRCAASHLDAGDPTRARIMLEETIDQVPPGLVRAQTLNLLAVVALVNDDFIEAAELLERALADTADDAALRSAILVSLSYARFNGSQLDAAVQRAEEAVAAASKLGGSPGLAHALGMSVMMRFLRGDGLDRAQLERALSLEDQDGDTPVAFRPSTQHVLLLDWTGHLDEAHQGMLSLRGTCFDEAALNFIDFNAVLNCVWRGDFDEAAMVAEDGVERAHQLGGDVPLAAALTSRATVAAYRGDIEQTRTDVAAALASYQRCNSQRLREWLVTAQAFLELSLGDAEAAVSSLKPLLSDFDPETRATEIIQASFLPDAAEAMISLGRLDDAEPLIDALQRNGRRLDRPWMSAVGARGRAMLLAARGDLTAATAAAASAIAEHARLPMPFELARTQLLLGQLQRRQRHRDAAAATLRDALATFERLGTKLWADRARAELARGTSGRRRAEGLTPAEQRVAALAVSGLTNRDIAAALFISPKTVEVNLSRIYRKLNIRSRMELYRTFEAPPEAQRAKE